MLGALITGGMAIALAAVPHVVYAATTTILHNMPSMIASASHNTSFVEN